MFQNSQKYIKGVLGIIVALLILLTSCKKFINVEAPETALYEANVYKSDETATAVLTGLYASMSTGGFATGISSVSLLTGLSADELDLYSGVINSKYISYYQNALGSIHSATEAGSEFWIELYNKIFTCNAILDGLANSTTLSFAARNQLTGEAKFLRAFFYFYLANFYSDVPLVLSSDYKLVSNLARTRVDLIYAQIINDLVEAKSLLSPDYLDGNLKIYPGQIERLRPNKWVATALLARVYLFRKDYANAELAADEVIANSVLYRLVDLSSISLMNNSESIWQLQPVKLGRNTEDGFVFKIPGSGLNSQHPVYISKRLLDKFEPNDLRRINWIDSTFVGDDTIFYPAKYKIAELNLPVTEYLVVLRLAELYLIRSESRAHNGNLIGALEDLNLIRNRAGLVGISTDDVTELSKSINNERQVELFTEWGHRWLDLKRTDNIDSVMALITPNKGGIWNSNWRWFPIPLVDLQKNQNLTQNAGY